MFPPPPPSMPRGIDHVGLTVPDIEAATRFFVQAFGARVIYDTHDRDEPPQEGQAAEAKLGLRAGEAVRAIRLLRLGNGASLELFEVTGGGRTAPGGLGDIGLSHIALFCDDVDAALAHATAAGASPLAGPNPLAGPEEGEGNRMIYVRTPWGMLIELIAYPVGVSQPEGVPRWSPASGAA